MKEKIAKMRLDRMQLEMDLRKAEIEKKINQQDFDRSIYLKYQEEIIEKRKAERTAKRTVWKRIRTACSFALAPAMLMIFVFPVMHDLKVVTTKAAIIGTITSSVVAITLMWASDLFVDEY